MSRAEPPRGPHQASRPHHTPPVRRPAPPPEPETVKDGDSLSKIAERRHVRLIAVEAANPDLPRVIHRGDRVIIPRDGPKLPRASYRLNAEGNHQFTESELWPAIEAAAKRYGIPPRVIAGIIAQESSMKNLLLHKDGTGRGLVGLDPSGELDNFERWSGAKTGTSKAPLPISPLRQIEFLALRLSEMKKDKGSLRSAVSAWHTGGALDQEYLRLVEEDMGRLEHPGSATIP
jgi:hypothetical protein